MSPRITGSAWSKAWAASTMMRDRAQGGRLLVVLSLLVIVGALGLVQLPRTQSYREHLLRRVHEPELRAQVEKNPGDALAHYYLGQAYDRTGRTVQAAREYAKALALD